MRTETSSGPPRPLLATRERLFHLLAEAAELEHNLLCSYLFALFSLKQKPSEDVSAAEFAAIQRWDHTLLSVCVEEMLHLAQIANLSVAVGMRPHFNRPNLPVPPGYHPADIVVELAPFDRDTIAHFLYLERPEGSAVADAPTYLGDAGVARERTAGLMPAAPEYSTIGEFYAHLGNELRALCARLEPERVFSGSRSSQITAKEIGSAQLIKVCDEASALAAIDLIVHQGEGAPGESETSHFWHFRQMLEELDAMQTARPAFSPAGPVARNPVMRPPIAAGPVHIIEPLAARTLDLANSLYNLMLRCLVQSYDSHPDDPSRGPLVKGSLDLMKTLALVGRRLSTLPAQPGSPTPTAGITFTTLRATEGYVGNGQACAFILERASEMSTGLSNRFELGECSAEIRAGLCEFYERLRMALALESAH